MDDEETKYQQWSVLSPLTKKSLRDPSVSYDAVWDRKLQHVDTGWVTEQNNMPFNHLKIYVFITDL